MMMQNKLFYYQQQTISCLFLVRISDLPNFVFFQTGFRNVDICIGDLQLFQRDEFSNDSSVAKMSQTICRTKNTRIVELWRNAEIC